MGGGNAQKSATARARNEAKKAKAGKGSQLAVNQAAQNVICQEGGGDMWGGLETPCLLDRGGGLSRPRTAQSKACTADRPERVEAGVGQEIFAAEGGGRTAGKAKPSRTGGGPC
eukprot:jgi/Undpi1/1056/HiC_scaffold_10.g04519.m1